MTRERTGRRSPRLGVESSLISCLDVSGRLTRRDRQRRQVFEFQVPERADRLRVDFRYQPGEVAGVHNLLTLSIFDPRVFRGAAHRWNQAQTVTIDARAATPGFLPGRITAGRWRIELDAHEIVNDGLSSGGCVYGLLVRARLDQSPDHRSVPRPQRLNRARVAHVNRGAGWYRGDLHSHSVHCDGVSTIAEMARTAGAMGADFLATTGHNTISQWRLDEPWPDGLLLIRGVECTTYFGHANLLGTSDWIDWRVESREAGARSIVAQAREQGALAVVNHPRARGNPGCTGCRWDYPVDDLPAFDAIEVWNSGWHEAGNGNGDALTLWTTELMAGSRLTAVAGTDSHSADEYEREDLPYTWVYAEGLSEREVLHGLRSGRAYLSSGPRLTFVARHGSGGRATLPGDRLHPGRFHLRIETAHLTAPATLWLVADGAKQRIGDLIRPGGTLETVANAEQWWNLELRARDPAESLLTLTNPVYHR